LFFGAIAGVLALLAIVLAIPLAITYAHTGLVPRFPTAILATGLMILASLNLFAGLILDTVVHGRREMRRIAYLAQPGPLSD
ncbi:MAG: glycosyl transferase, partial [Sphingomonadales bacterium]